jgi:hypothetical protein
MAQKTLTVTPVALFATVGGKTEERGNCACALVGSAATNPPKFNLVCYNEQRVTLCSASITSNNEQSIQFQMQTAEYATFCDNTGNKWSIMFLRSADIDQFCANLGVACYGAASKPTHSHTVCDLSHPTQRSKTLKLGDRCKVKFSAFDVQRGETANDVPLVTRLLGTNGDIPYNFACVQSAYSILPDGKGFENAVVGMAENSCRVVVLPASVPRSCHNPYGAASIVFVIHLARILAEDVPVVTQVVEPPTVGLNGSGNENGGALALVPVQMELANSSPKSVSSSTSADRPKPGSAMDPTYSGVGVPAEHMTHIQKIAAAVNSATTQLRDLEDKILAFQEDWKQTVNRPKPSTLTPAALEQQVKLLILEHERVRDEISRRDELIRSIEERNRDLQKRMDKAAQIAQQLLDEKQVTVSTTGDIRLEQDRQIMKLQEQITKASTERDDINRHLTSVKKLLDISDSELRDVKGKHEVLQVQIQAMNNKLDAAEDQLGEERSRRKAMEAKVAAMNEEIRQHAADLHMKNAQSQDLGRKIESDRLHHLQLMEDERQRRALETQQLRSEIVSELQLREEKFQADRARVMEDHFARGRDEGRAIGKKNALIDVEARVQELQLDAQRAKTELDAYKTQVRATQEEAMGESRRLEAIVSTLKNSTDAETRRKAQTEFRLQSLRTKVRNAQDATFVQVTNCVHRLKRPCRPDDLMRLLQQLKDGENPDFSFQIAQHEAEAQMAFQRRFQWITEELETQYRSRLNALYHQTWLPATTSLHDETVQTIQRLWKEREEAFAGQLLSEENQNRYFITKEEGTEFAAIEAFLESLVVAQRAIADEESSARAVIVEEEPPLFESIISGLRKWLALIVEQQQAVIEAEAEAREQIVSAEAAISAEIEVFLAQQKEERIQICDAEAEARSPIQQEEQAEWEQHNKDLENALFEKIIAEQQVFFEEETEVRYRLTTAEEEDRSELEAAASQGAQEARAQEQFRLEQEAEVRQFVEASFQEVSATDSAADSEFESLLAEMDREKKAIEHRAAELAKAAAKKDTKIVASSNPLGDAPVALAADSDSDSDSGFRSKPVSKAPPKKSAPAKAAAAPAKLFDSDSESEKAPAAAPPPPKKVVPKKVAAAKLFDSDDD